MKEYAKLRIYKKTLKNLKIISKKLDMPIIRLIDNYADSHCFILKNKIK